MIEANPGVATTSRLETIIPPAATSEYRVEPKLTWWSAIFAGAFAAVSAQVVFAMMGSTIGLSVVSATTDTPERGLTIGAGIWWLVTGLISLFFGGWVAGRLCRVATPFLAGIHGFLTWCTVTVISAALVTVASGAAAGGSYTAFGNAITSRNPSGDYRTTSQQLMNDAQGNAGQNANSQNMTSADTPQAKQAAKRAAIASAWTLLALVLGATVASLGGRAGAKSLAGDDDTPRVTAARS